MRDQVESIDLLLERDWSYHCLQTNKKPKQIKLFIKSTREIGGSGSSKADVNNRSTLEKRYVGTSASYSAIVQRSFPKLNLVAILSIALPVILVTLNQHTIASNGQTDAQQQIKPSSLPTVIVRGFLNYRTTVDGTVLLFTPDAGSTLTSTSNIQPTTIQSSSSLPGLLPISSVSQRQLETSSQLGSDTDWKPVPASSFRPVQTAFRPAPSSSSFLQPSAVADWQPVASKQLSAPEGTGSLQPSVQTDDVIQELRPPKEIQVSSEPSTQPSRPMRPKRPSLGFHGQGVRSGSVQAQPQQQSQTSQTDASSNTHINGIRKPGLIATTSSPETVSSTQASNAFQARLASTSAKLRGKYRRPSFNSSSTASPLVSSAAEVSELDSANSALSSLQSQPQAELGGLEARMGDILSPMAAAAASPVVGSDEVIASSGDQEGSSSPNKPDSRVGEQRPSQLLSGGLTGSLSNGELEQPIDAFFQGDQPQVNPSSEASEHRVLHSPQPANKARKHNDKLNGWLDQHHNKFVPRPAPSASSQSGHLSHQLAANLNSLAPSFSANLNQMAPVRPTPVVGSSTVSETSVEVSPTSNPGMAASSLPSSAANESSVQLQTITKTYSTIMTTYKTRLVPLQVKSSTAIHTITENYVMTKMMTAFQTLPVMGEFILPEPVNARAPFELFNEPSSELGAESQMKRAQQEQPIQAPAAASAPAVQAEPEEQPISLAETPKSANDWLHDFSNPDTGSSQLQQSQQQSLAALLGEQQAQQFPQLLGSEPLDQLASSLDPAQLLAEGGINIPDLNNPLVLAAAIQNPQLAAVILAAQQLQLKQRAAGKPQQANQLAAASVSLSTSLSTTVRPSTYTVRDTMYTTRLVSFRDGRTVRTRTVSEPGQVIEQVLTSMATEVTPVTVSVAIRPTAALQGPSGASAVLAPAGSQSSQSTLNNALLATQLAGLLARRQQQLQPSMASSSSNLSQLAALQQLIGQQQQQRQLASLSPSSKPFQPNLQQLLQSMQQQQQQQHQQQQPAPSQNGNQAGQPSRAESGPQASRANEGPPSSMAPTPALPQLPITTTLTSLQVRTYTVHNAFKTIYRTITSTQLLTSTLFPAGARALG